MGVTRAFQSRKRAPSKAEWKRIEPHLKLLYVDRKLPLQEVAIYLSREHNFHAGLHMYKHRIAKWRSRKNFKKEELEAVAELFEIFIQAGLQAPTALIDNRPVPIQRVRRHFGSSFQTHAPPAHRTTGMEFIQHRDSSVRGHVSRKSPVPRILLQQSSELYGLEATLIQVNNYYTWRLTKSHDYFVQDMYRNSNGTFQTSDTMPSTLELQFVGLAEVEISQGNAELAHFTISTLCESPSALLLLQPTHLLEALLVSLLQSLDDDVLHLQYHVCAYLAAHARKTLGENHPITMVLKLAQNVIMLENASMLLGRLVVHILRNQLGPSSRRVMRFEIDMITKRCARYDFDTVHDHFQRLLDQCIQEFGEGDPLTRDCLFSKGWMYYNHDRNDEAREILLHGLSLDECYLQDYRAAGFSSIKAMGCLGHIATKNGDYVDAITWYSRAYESSCNHDSEDHPLSELYLGYLSQVTAAQKRLSGSCAAADNLGDEEEPDTNLSSLVDGIQEKLSRMTLELEKSTPAQFQPWNVWEEDLADAGGSDSGTPLDSERPPSTPQLPNIPRSGEVIMHQPWMKTIDQGQPPREQGTDATIEDPPTIGHCNIFDQDAEVFDVDDNLAAKLPVWYTVEEEESAVGRGEPIDVGQDHFLPTLTTAPDLAEFDATTVDVDAALNSDPMVLDVGDLAGDLDHWFLDDAALEEWRLFEEYGQGMTLDVMQHAPVFMS